MTIRTEIIEIGGRTLVRTWSDAGVRIANADGIVYDEAIDVSEREYVETDEPITDSEPYEEEEQA